MCIISPIVSITYTIRITYTLIFLNHPGEKPYDNQRNEMASGIKTTDEFYKSSRNIICNTIIFKSMCSAYRKRGRVPNIFQR